ncbi:DUF4387 domain-containing protein [Hirschia baltica]|uniref:DUF4387 domain-containing protein n=1 Tax=Hirschia baltica (strain ATCC 49814 / DSM 5838 / IFAM 1418) TaxID=582402 RepID=C6XJB7_HIRBI|nr:DUF4387 domain-containing protein [Hirschia baltica]ACT59212.1 conserved hypothetical protein [Hirschia baltica ATCC 49814]
MTLLRDVCEHIRSKQAGPFWVTIDIWFNSRENFERFKDSLGIAPDVFEKLYNTDRESVKKIEVADFNLVKISYPRATPQGGMIERDLHSGQQCMRLLNQKLD